MVFSGSSELCLEHIAESGGKSVWLGLVLLRERCTRGHSWTHGCAKVHMSPLPSPVPPQIQPLEYNALCVPAQDAHLFTVGLSGTTQSRIKLVRPRSTHSFRSGVHDAVHSKNRRRVHQEPLGHNTRLVHHCHTTVAVWKPSTTVSYTSVRT